MAESSPHAPNHLFMYAAPSRCTYIAVLRLSSGADSHLGLHISQGAAGVQIRMHLWAGIPLPVIGCSLADCCQQINK